MYFWKHGDKSVFTLSKKSLEVFSSCKSKTRIENIEDIEILRFLELGQNVKMIELSNNSISVDTKQDILKVKKY